MAQEALSSERPIPTEVLSVTPPSEILQSPEVVDQSPPVLVILDTGAQYGGLVDRRAREWGIRTEILSIYATLEEIAAKSPVGVVVPGGPKSTYDDDAPHIQPGLLDFGVPILGICYGQQEIARAAGGVVQHTSQHEGATVARQDGVLPITVTAASSRLLAGLDAQEKVLLTHGDSVTQAPDGFQVTSTSNGIITSMESPERGIYTTQFHPEASDTAKGSVIFDNFLRDICEQEPSYTFDDQLEESLAEIRAVPEDRDLLVALSGGVDSAVSARLLVKAGVDPSRIHLVHVDHGLMRSQESKAIVEEFEKLSVHVHVIDAFERFANATMTLPDGSQSKRLREAEQGDAELIRKIIGNVFLKEFEDFSVSLGLRNPVLVQGTLRPDLIESAQKQASKHADVVVTHHNANAATDEKRERGEIIEPLRNLYKDQVRDIGRAIGLPESIVGRQPFPGPGLGVRILTHDGSTMKKRPINLRNGTVVTPEVHAELQAEARNWFKKYAGSTALLHVIPVVSRGVRGDASADGLVSAFEFRNFEMQSTSSRLPWEEMVEIGMQLTNTFPDIIRFGNLKVRKGIKNRIFSSLPLHLERHEAAITQQADLAARMGLEQFGEYNRVSQLPVILTHATLTGRGLMSVVRPFISPDFMTGRAAIPGKDIDQRAAAMMVRKVLDSQGIESVYYDLTHKPPGRTEWV